MKLFQDEIFFLILTLINTYILHLHKNKKVPVQILPTFQIKFIKTSDSKINKFQI